MGCGDGDQEPQDFIRWTAKRTAYKPWAKIQTAHSWSDGRAESAGSLMEKRSRIFHSVSHGNLRPSEYSLITKVIYGSELITMAWYISIREEQMYLLNRRAFQATPPRHFLRTVKAICG